MTGIVFVGEEVSPRPVRSFSQRLIVPLPVCPTQAKPRLEWGTLGTIGCQESDEHHRMESMKRRLAFFIAATITLGIGLGAAVRAWAQDEDEGPMSNMHFVVLREGNGKPVRNAAVVLHPVTRKGTQALGGMELKTDDEGKTGIDGIPYGPLRVQVLAPGFQTFGEDYQVNRAEMVITIKLKRPVGQYSSYGVQESKKADGKKADDKKADDSQGADKKSDAAKPQ